MLGPLARLAGLGVVLAVVTFSSGRVMAGPTEDAAREETRKGNTAYHLGSYEEAAGHYEAAFRLVQDPALLYNLGQSWRLAGRTEKALIAYRSYLRTAAPDAPNRDQAERRIAELEGVVAERKTAPPPPVAPAQPPPSPLVVGTAPPREPVDSSAPVYRRWWFWTGAAVVAGAVATAVLLSTSKDTRASTCGVMLDGCATVRP